MFCLPRTRLENSAVGAADFYAVKQWEMRTSGFALGETVAM
jgi:hypothetical protein